MRNILNLVSDNLNQSSLWPRVATPPRRLSPQVMVKQPPPCPGFLVPLAAWWQGWANASSECSTSEVREAGSSVVPHCETDTPTHVWWPVVMVSHDPESDPH